MFKIKLDNVTVECEEMDQTVSLVRELRELPTAVPATAVESRRHKKPNDKPPLHERGPQDSRASSNVTRVPLTWMKLAGALVEAGTAGIDIEKLSKKSGIKTRNLGIFGAWAKKLNNGTGKRYLNIIKANGETYWAGTPALAKLYYHTKQLV